MVTYGRPPTPSVKINGIDSFTIVPSPTVFTEAYHGSDHPNAFEYSWSAYPDSGYVTEGGPFAGKTVTNLGQNGVTHYAKYRVQSNTSWSPWSPVRSFLMPGGGYVLSNGKWKRALVYVKSNGTWKLVQPLVRYQGFWIETRS